MLTLTARITGRMRHGQPPKPPFIGPPPGPCCVQAHEGVVSLVWQEGDASRSLVISLEEFEDNLQAGVITIVPVRPPRNAATLAGPPG